MKKIFKKMLISLFVFLAIIGFIIESICLGNPFTKMIVKSAAESYLSQHYVNQNFEIYKMKFLPGFLNYRVSVKKSGSTDANFDIQVENGKVQFDNYNYTVSNFHNTQKRLSDELSKNFNEILNDKNNLDLNYSGWYGQFNNGEISIIDDKWKDKFYLDMPFDKNNIEVPISLSVNNYDYTIPKEYNINDAIELMKKCDVELQENGYNVDYFSFALHKQISDNPKLECSLLTATNMTREELYSEKIVQKLEERHKNECYYCNNK